MKKLLSLMFVLVMGLSAFAQTSLKGRVIDEATQTPVVEAKILLVNQNISTTTNAAGEFQLLYLEAMDEELVIEAEGFVAALELISLKENEVIQLGLIQEDRCPCNKRTNLDLDTHTHAHTHTHSTM